MSAGRPPKHEVNNGAYRALAAAIVLQADRDLKRVRKDGPFALEGEIVNEETLTQFFRSDWCGMLLGESGITGAAIIKARGLGDVADT